MNTFVLILVIFYKASIIIRKSYKIIILGKNIVILFENVTSMLLGNTNKNTCFFSNKHLYIYPQLLESEVC